MVLHVKADLKFRTTEIKNPAIFKVSGVFKIVLSISKKLYSNLTQGMKIEYRRLGKFKDSEFATQTSWSNNGEPSSTLAHEPDENPSRC